MANSHAKQVETGPFNVERGHGQGRECDWGGEHGLPLETSVEMQRQQRLGPYCCFAATVTIPTATSTMADTS